MTDTVLVINNNGMGVADEELQHKLIRSHLQMLHDDDRIPAAICLYTEGIKLAVEGSPVIDHLKALIEKGAQVIICSTCLNHYGLQDKVQVGIVGGMHDIIEAQWQADKVITL